MTVALKDTQKPARGQRARRKAKQPTGRDRSTGLFEAVHGDEELYALVAQILHAAGVAEDAHISQIQFDKARGLKPDFASCPTARQIVTRLKRSWEQVVQIAHNHEGGPSFMRAAVTTQRAEENNVFDERNLVLGLTTISKRLGRRTFGEGQYDVEREELLKDAVRDNTVEFWRAVIPTAAQVRRIAGGSWDVALAMAQLEPRRDIAHIGGGTAAVGRVKLRFEKSQRQSPSKKKQTGKKAVGKRATRNKKTAKQSAASSPAPKQEIRGGQKRHIPALEIVDVLVEFAYSQQAWPTSTGAINAWAVHFNVSVSRCETFKGDSREVLIAEATEKMKAEGLTPPAADVRVTRSHVKKGAPVREGLPVRKKPEYTLRECIDLVKECMLEKKVRLDLRQPLYLDWATGVPGRPSPGVFQQYGGLARIRGLAAAELKAERRGR